MSAATASTHTTSHDLAVFEVSRWERFLYEKRREIPSGIVSEAERTVLNYQTGAILRSGEEESVEERMSAGGRDVSTFGGEVFARLYGAPERREQASGPAWIDRAHKVIDALDTAFTSLREQVSGDPDFSAIAAARLMSEIAPQIAKIVDEEAKTAERTEEESRAGAEAADGALRAALRRAIAGVSAEAGDLRAALSGISPGLAAAPAAHEQADPRRMLLAERLRSDPRLREVVRRAGRIQRIAARPDSRRRTDGREEIVDVERGGDIARLLPSELARLAHPGLRLLALRGIVERTALQYRMVGTEPEGRGPIVLLLDESSSMNTPNGQPHLWARAVGIATLSIGAKQRREVTVIGFNGRVSSVHRLRRDGSSALLSTSDPSRVESELGSLAEVVLAVAARGAVGGTSFDRVLSYALTSGVRAKRADLIFVTDDNCTVAPAILAEIAAHRTESGLRVYGFTINGGRIGGAAAAVCDEVSALDVLDPAAAIGRSAGLR
jgi:uncharacterized protein with von Willebrand factor type A (vWA) domain